ncbi:hypothetical protein BKA93DRAFT_735608 [Sparassis latifolia]
MTTTNPVLLSGDLDAIREFQRAEESYYSLSDEELAFFKSQTDIQDEGMLKAHIILVQALAFAVFPYACIRRFTFLKYVISRMPKYEHLLKLGRERKDAIFLDIGCCFGNDVRKAVADGFPIENVIASDLEQEFWNLGHSLFNSTQEKFPVPFLRGDALDEAFLPVSPPLRTPAETPAPALSSLTSLAPLHGRVSAIHASSFFHLFGESQQAQLAHSLGALLSPVPGSVIFGAHAGMPTPCALDEESSRKKQYFCHSPQSWVELWEGVFGEGMVQVDARLDPASGTNILPTADNRPGKYTLVWSVMRV